ncbi:Mvp17/PMP22 family protein 1 [Schizosaccharomyces cryophilus OY26]|uniref:Mvp17/PMP22 family protein 1 n=1 Tax=Schizosaccharomyces cryophilus (strain OY26 / ATCC MYA-4695 / CBS 11777 / NBRC 106824 / NRRL Y48691) TaxID=653667 RepID=S9W5E2_SCHCR|nr:Mvp17/PMP22 family protein 1 [Schizosaccharomyces cryophilus OY26]EPY53155.1 Mvp17/PMP22 family protein 1 [Schizosaccharomyces cryophilus OY26]
MFARLGARYNALFNKAPISTMCFTAGTLGGLSDVLAQGITYYQTNKNAVVGLNGERIRFHPEIPNLARVLQFISFGFAISPLQFKWLKFLSIRFPVEKGVSNVVVRVLLDQAIFAPFGTAFFYSWMTITEKGKGFNDVREKLKNLFLPTLKANYLIWPFLQSFNFYLMPLQFQMPFACTCALFWNTFLSLKNAGSEETELQEIELF